MKLMREWFVLFEAHLSKWNTFVIKTPVNNNQIIIHSMQITANIIFIHFVLAVHALSYFLLF